MKDFMKRKPFLDDLNEKIDKIDGFLKIYKDAFKNKNIPNKKILNEKIIEIKDSLKKLEDLRKYISKIKKNIYSSEELEEYRSIVYHSFKFQPQNMSYVAIEKMLLDKSERLKPFDQAEMIYNFDENIEISGLCNGFVSIYIAFYSNKEHLEKSFVDYLNNENKKIKESTFFELILRTHRNQSILRQEKSDIVYDKGGMDNNIFIVKSPSDDADIKLEKRENFVDEILKALKSDNSPDFVAVDYRSNNGSHSVCFRCIKNSENVITAYAFFDPNLGEIIFDSDSKENDIKQFFNEWLKCYDIFFDVNEQETVLTAMTDSVLKRVGIVNKEKSEIEKKSRLALIENCKSCIPLFREYIDIRTNEQQKTLNRNKNVFDSLISTAAKVLIPHLDGSVKLAAANKIISHLENITEGRCDVGAPLVLTNFEYEAVSNARLGNIVKNFLNHSNVALIKIVVEEINPKNKFHNS